ncbi:MAG: hypothetical protein V2A58_09850 [Planctomycetota bacterium]
MRQSRAIQEVSRLVTRYRARSCFCAAVTGVLWGALIASVLAAGGAYLVRAELLSWEHLLALSCGVIGLAGGIGFLTGPLRRGSLLVAKDLDEAARSADLFSSSLDFGRRELDGEPVGAVYEQAVSLSGSLRVAALCRVRAGFPKWLWLVGPALLALFLLIPVREAPAVPGAGSTQEETMPAELVRREEPLAREGKRVIDELKRSSEEPDRESAQRLEELWRRLERGELTKSELVEGVGKLSDERVLTAGAQMQQLLSELREIASAFSSEASWKEVAQSLAEGQTASFADRLREEAEQMEQSSADKDEKRGLVDALKEAGEKRGSLTDRLGEKLAQAGKDLASDDLPRASTELSGAAQELEALGSKLNRMEALARSMEHLQRLKRLARDMPPLSPQGEPKAFSAQGEGRADSTKPGPMQQATGEGDAAKAGRVEAAGGEDQSHGEAEPAGGIGSAPEGPGLGEATEVPAARRAERATDELSDHGDVASLVLRSAQFAGEAHRGRREVLEGVRQALEAALSDERIPLGRRDLVRDYFERILPAVRRVDASSEEEVGAEEGSP